MQQFTASSWLLAGGSQSSRGKQGRNTVLSLQSLFQKERKCNHCKLEWQGAAVYLVESMVRKEGDGKDPKGEAEKGGMIIEMRCLICRVTMEVTMDVPTWWWLRGGRPQEVACMVVQCLAGKHRVGLHISIYVFFFAGDTCCCYFSYWTSLLQQALLSFLGQEQGLP